MATLGTHENYSCAAEVTLTNDQIRLAASLFDGDGDHEDKNPLTCEIERDHPGRHYSLVNVWGASEVWAVWDGTSVTLETFGDESQCHADHEGDVCTLPGDHAGLHDFYLIEPRTLVGRALDEFRGLAPG